MDKVQDNVFEKSFTFRRDLSWTFSSSMNLTAETEWNDATLISFKQDLNNVKSLLNVMEPGEWRRHTTKMSIAGRVIPHLQKLIQPELLTQAWCKFWEILNAYELVKTQNLKEGVFCSVHLCEAPGAFITAMNHYLKQNHKSVHWNWLANTLNPYYEGNSTGSAILDDRFIYHTLDHWHFGSKNTGDIFDPEMVTDLLTTIGNRKVHLITADGSIDCQDVPAEQENVVSKLFLAETYTALQLLSQHGCFLIKMFTFFEAQTISLLYMLNLCFKKVHVFKPATSKPGNSEVYVICLNYNGSKSAEKVLNIMKEKVYNGGCVFRKDSIPKTFLNQVIYCAEFFKNAQAETIKNNLAAFENMNQDAEQELKVLKQQCAEKFVKLYNLKPIDDTDKLAPSMTKDGETMLFEYSQKSGNLSFTERQALKNSWQRRLGSIRALARDMFRNMDPCNVFNDACTISDAIVKLVPGQVTLGSTVDKVHTSLFCPVQLVTAWNELEERFQKSGLTLSRDDSLHWSDKMLSEVKMTEDLKSSQIIFESMKMSIVTTQSYKRKLESVPIELQEERESETKPFPQETEKDYQIILIKNCLKCLHLSGNGDIVLLRLHSVHTRFTAGILFLFASLFKRISVVHSCLDHQDPQIWCFFDFCPNPNLHIIFQHFCCILEYLCQPGSKVVLESLPLPMLCGHPFYKFIVNRSSSVLLNRVWFLTKRLQV